MVVHVYMILRKSDEPALNLPCVHVSKDTLVSQLLINKDAPGQ